MQKQKEPDYLRFSSSRAGDLSDSGHFDQDLSLAINGNVTQSIKPPSQVLTALLVDCSYLTFRMQSCSFDFMSEIPDETIVATCLHGFVDIKKGQYCCSTARKKNNTSLSVEQALMSLSDLGCPIHLITQRNIDLDKNMSVILYFWTSPDVKDSYKKKKVKMVKVKNMEKMGDFWSGTKGKTSFLSKMLRKSFSMEA